ncbi:hypothetical protein ACIHCQ_37075 [Streptomyces sp. NPDC052236]|uniref:hypothetical protein n=1 Tax=Streptomyces sp. NPDC052236 TaxID=3365686 RepID=UPI0037CF9D7C
MSSTERPPNSPDIPRRRRSPFAVASVAAAVLVAGGGTYFAAAGFSGGDGGGGGGGGSAEAGSSVGSGDVQPPPLSLDIGEPDPSGGGTVYRARGELPDGPDRAAVHRPQGAVTAAEVTRLAKALGVPGTPRAVGSAWKIGAEKDGAGPLLQVNTRAPGTWTFARFLATPGGDNCLKGKACPPSDTGATSPDAGAAVSPEAAKKAAAPVLKALGQDDAKLRADQLMGAVRVVNADPVVGGLPTYGWSTGIQVGADGQVVGGSGQLKEPRKGAEYPVLSAEEALKRLNNASKDAGRVGIGGCATPVPLEGEQKPAAPCEPETGATPSGPERLTIAKAVFGLAAQYVDGQQALVPSWLFEVERKGDGVKTFTVTQTAVDPKYLNDDSAPSPDPVAPSERRVLSYSVDGAERRTLSVTFWGGVCSDYAATASESGGQVKIAITESKPDPERVCILIAKELTEKVTLDKPLGDRKVVDAATGEAIPMMK